jgi:hypothetical protein
MKEEAVHLEIVGDDSPAGGPAAGKVGKGDEGGEEAHDGGEEAEDALDAVQGIVHGCRGSRVSVNPPSKPLPSPFPVFNGVERVLQSSQMFESGLSSRHWEVRRDVGVVV